MYEGNESIQNIRYSATRYANNVKPNDADDDGDKRSVDDTPKEKQPHRIKQYNRPIIPTSVENIFPNAL